SSSSASRTYTLSLHDALPICSESWVNWALGQNLDDASAGLGDACNLSREFCLLARTGSSVSLRKSFVFMALGLLGVHVSVDGQQLLQNWHGPKGSDCLIKTKHCEGR